MLTVVKKEPKPEGDDAIDFRMVDIDRIEPNDYNPNDMEAELFEAIVEQVKDEGMNQPILCRENPDKEGFFLIVDGEHRWKAAKIAGKKLIAIVVVAFDPTTAKVRTLSMNHLRGQNIPIKLARLLVDLHKVYSAADIRKMTGIGEKDQQSVLELLKVPDFKATDGVHLKPQNVQRPVQVHIALLPDEGNVYTKAMKRAMNLCGEDVVALIGHEVTNYDQAMKAAMGLAGAKLRNVALALICETFNSLPADQKKALAEAAHKKIYDKLATDAAAKEADKQAAAKVS